MSLRNLKKLVKNFEIHDYTLEVIKYPSKYSANEMITEGSLKYRILNFCRTKAVLHNSNLHLDIKKA